VATAPVLNPHEASPAAIAGLLDTDPRAGLSDDEADRRLREFGSNELEGARPPSLPRLLFDAATEPFVLLLLGAGIAAVALGEVRDGLLVLGGLVPIVGADVITQFRAERALDELRAAAAPVARVRRGGRAIDIPAAHSVPGDVVLLRAGDIVPADIRLTVASGLAIDRSALTGESVPERAAVESDPAEAALIERRSMAYSGTSVVSGSGEGIVVATGAATETGRIAVNLGAAERRRSPLQRELDRLVRILLVVAIGLIVITVGSGFLRGNPPGENLLAGISAAIAAIPEEPPILLAVILGLGAHRLLRKGVLVRRLNAEETLGAVEMILTDKTGTLTQNRLAVADILTDAGSVDGSVVRLAGDRSDVRAAILHDALRAEADAWRAAGSGARPGSFTTAIRDALDPLGGPPDLEPDDLLDGSEPTDRRPYAMTRARHDGRVEELAFGAPEAVLGLAHRLAPRTTDAWRDAIAEEAAQGRRLLLLAERDETGDWRPRAIVAFADPLRAGVRDALERASLAGIQTIVVTGDHPTTTTAIAREAGLRAERVVTGSELDEWDDATLDKELARLDIVARAVPEQKLRLVAAARRAGRTIAVTGDGVNDAPALNHADVAVAMGSGTAVAKGASDLVLGDDSFATLLFAVGDGRRIVANVRKGLVFLVSTHVALLGFVLLGTLAGISQPLLPIQILWLELFIDVSTSVAFEREPEEPDAMRMPPRSPREALLPASLLLRIAVAGGFSAFAALLLVLAQPGGAEHGRWLAFTTLVVGQAVRAYANRSLTTPLTLLPPNRFLAFACIAVVVVQAIIPFVPPLADAFRASALDLGEWALVAIVAGGPALLAELVRRLRHAEWVA
jgi:Ca2+-transporting ATPase